MKHADRRPGTEAGFGIYDVCYDAAAVVSTASALSFPKSPPADEFLLWLDRQVLNEDRAALYRFARSFALGQTSRYACDFRLRAYSGDTVYFRLLLSAPARDKLGRARRLAVLLLNTTPARPDQPQALLDDLQHLDAESRQSATAPGREVCRLSAEAVDVVSKHPVFRPKEENGDTYHQLFCLEEDIAPEKLGPFLVNQQKAVFEQPVPSQTPAGEEDRLRRAVDSQAQRILALTDELMHTEQRERHRLADELHNYLAQLLAGIAYRLSSVERITRSKEATELLQHAIEATNEAVAFTRSLMTQLHPRRLLDAGLAEAAHWLAEQMAPKGLAVEVDADESLPEMPSDQREYLFQTLRELLVNVAKHAGIGEAQVRLKNSQGVLILEVEDMGKGFDPQKLEQLQRDSSHFGLMSMRERIEDLGGELQITSAPGEGCRVRVVLPPSI